MLCVYRAVLSVCGALLHVGGALLGVCRALLSVHRALLHSDVYIRYLPRASVECKRLEWIARLMLECIASHKM